MTVQVGLVHYLLREVSTVKLIARVDKKASNFPRIFVARYVSRPPSHTSSITKNGSPSFSPFFFLPSLYHIQSKSKPNAMNILLRRVNLLGIAVCLPCLAQGFTSSRLATRPSVVTVLGMVQNRGLEVRREGATPTGAKQKKEEETSC